uniref:SH2 domain protein n=1 Tax=Bursaphelenchus xylophilus TaxID=6326 RepID=A0A1I7S0H6_BURXY
MELWQQCVQWLRACGVLQDFIKFERLEAFAYFLKDGILLCRLAQRLDENSIDESQIHTNATCDSEVQYECNYLAFGRPVQDGQVKVYDPKVSDSTKQRHVFLFERMIMFCKIAKNEKYEFRSQYALSDLQMADEEQSNKSATLPRKLTQTIFDNRNSFMLVFRRQLPTGTVPATEPPGYIQFIFKTEAQRDLWKKNVEKALDISEPQQAILKHHKVFYKTYKEAVACDACKRLLNGLFLQGYNCKVCNQNLHYNCLGLQVCAGSRPRPRPRTSHQSFNGTLNNNVLQRYMSGERVQAVQSIASPDSAVLSFQKDDVIEVVQENQDGTITGRLIRTPSKIGVIRRDSVRRVPSNQGFTPTGSQTSLVQRRSSFNHLIQVDNLPAGRILPRRSTHDRISASSTSEFPMNMPLISSAILDYHCPAEEDRPIKDYPWYFSNLTREEAQNFIENQPDGTFLVRWSQTQSILALSVAYQGVAKHMKIEYDTSRSMYYLHDSIFFHNIPSLINCYRKMDLSEGFKNMSGTLSGTPFRTTHYQAVHAFQHATDTQKYLAIEPNEMITIIDTSGEENGWWKGESEATGKIGYFPLSYVREVPPFNDELMT